MVEERANRRLRAVAAVFALYMVWVGLLPDTIPSGADGLISTALLVLFALLHGSERYGWVGIAAFFVICLVISNAFENLSILTGFPFGHYYYTDILGPKIFLVPIMIGGAYVGAGYLSWTVAHVLLGRTGRVEGVSRWSVAAVGTILMVCWDLSLDPSASTIRKWWIWLDGGDFFGVPFRNFLGWYLTVFVFLAVFAWYQAGQSPAPRRLSRQFWFWPVVMYFFLGLRFLLRYVSGVDDTTVTDAAGHTWMIRSIVAASALVALFTMVAFAVIAWLRLYGGDDEPVESG